MIGWGVSILWGSKIVISHWLSQWPLTQGWRYRAACDHRDGMINNECIMTTLGTKYYERPSQRNNKCPPPWDTSLSWTDSCWRMIIQAQTLTVVPNAKPSTSMWTLYFPSYGANIRNFVAIHRIHRSHQSIQTTMAWVTRRVALYLETHRNTDSKKACTTGVLDRWHNCLLIYWRTSCLVRAFDDTYHVPATEWCQCHLPCSLFSISNSVCFFLYIAL